MPPADQIVTLTPGRFLLTLSAVGLTAGAYTADWNETHVLNPNWPPHARFHNGQTMSMSAGLGLCTLYYTWRAYSSVQSARQGIVSAILFGSLYWITAFSAVAYPGAKAVDPEFRHKYGSDFPQKWVFAGVWAMAVAGGMLELRRLGANSLKSVL